jgi:MoaA/NifB/PqqE/SkfB family radical SAM enzyme
MKAKRLIDESTCIALYNWGEPFLHPDLNEILEFLHQSRIRFALSTNASKLVSFVDKPVFETLTSITFSMCGFSQASYDKIHKFNFEKIKANILNILDSLRARGFRGKPQIAYHVYQFNIGEIQAAKAFAAKHGLDIACSLAFINDYERSKQYITGATDNTELRKMSQQLILYPYEEAKTKAPADYKCPQFSCLVLDDKAQVEVCCVSSAKLKNITAYEPEELDTAKRTHPICRECRNLNIDYIMHNPVMWDKLTGSKGVLRKLFNKLTRKVL